jgi:hypothetical protein
MRSTPRPCTRSSRRFTTRDRRSIWKRRCATPATAALVEKSIQTQVNKCKTVAEIGRPWRAAWRSRRFTSWRRAAAVPDRHRVPRGVGDVAGSGWAGEWREPRGNHEGSQPGQRAEEKDRQETRGGKGEGRQGQGATEEPGQTDPREGKEVRQGQVARQMSRQEPNATAEAPRTPRQAPREEGSGLLIRSELNHEQIIG